MIAVLISPEIAEVNAQVSAQLFSIISSIWICMSASIWLKEKISLHPIWKTRFS